MIRPCLRCGTRTVRRTYPPRHFGGRCLVLALEPVADAVPATIARALRTTAPATTAATRSRCTSADGRQDDITPRFATRLVSWAASRLPMGLPGPRAFTSEQQVHQPVDSRTTTPGRGRTEPPGSVASTGSWVRSGYDGVLVFRLCAAAPPKDPPCVQAVNGLRVGWAIYLETP